LIFSRGHPNDIFASASGSRVLLVVNTMPRINIENRVHAKSVISFGVWHRDVTCLLIVFIPQYGVRCEMKKKKQLLFVS